MPDAVVVTGVGIVSPIGLGMDDFSAALRAGRSGAGPIRAFDCAGFATTIAAEVEPGADLARYADVPKAVKHMSRASLFGVAAAAMARAEARLARDAVDPFRLGISLGVGGMGPVDNEMLRGEAEAMLSAAERSGSYAFDVPSFAAAYRERTNPIAALRALPNIAAAHLAIQHNARGPSNTLATACTAGTQAIGEGAWLIRRGSADVVIAGGTDAMINPVGVLGFGMLGTLSCRNGEPQRASRPFERDRDGFVIGEGAGILILERESFARARGATILAEVVGYAATGDAYRITDERPDASGAAAAIRLCLESAGAGTSDVGYINAHGTGTVMNDRTETAAIRQAFGAAADGVSVSSTKSMTGHLLAAAGAIEAAVCIIALTQSFLPPTINYDAPDPACDLDYVPNVARAADCRVALSNSFGFGGQNACLLLART